MKYTKAQLIWGPLSTERITLSFNKNDLTNPYFVKMISGLEAPPINLSIENKAVEGGIFGGARPENRHLVILLGYNPDYGAGVTVGDLRKKLYPMLSPTQSQGVIFKLLNEAETEWVQTFGRIERLETNIFSKDPEMQIVMPCLSPFLEQAMVNYPNLSSLTGLTSIPVNIDGDAPTGFSISFGITAATLTSFRLTKGTERLHITYPFKAQDTIIINTIHGQKSVSLNRPDAGLENLVRLLSSDSVWLQLTGGSNTLVPNTTGYTVNSFSYTPRHWGV